MKLKKLITTIFRVAIMVVVLWGLSYWVYAVNKSKPVESPIQTVNRIHSFYVDSGYDRKSLYMADKEVLWEIKQDVLDSLSYKDTIEYVAIQNKQQTGMVSNDLLNLTDDTLKLADEGISRVEKPEFLQINTEEAVKDDGMTASWKLFFQNLLQ